MPKSVDVKTALCWTGATHLRWFHVVSEKQHPEMDNIMPEKYRLLKRTSDYVREMRQLIRDRSYSRILDLFEDMKSRSIPFDVAVCMLVIKAYLRMNNVDMVKRVLDDIMASRLKLDKRELFNSIIRDCENTGDVDAAFKLYRQMQKDDRILPDSATYRSLINVCRRGKDVNRARKVFNEMVKKVGAKVGGFNAMMEVYVENVDSDTGEAYLRECKYLLSLIKSKKIQLHADTYLYLVKLSGKLGRLDEALGYLKKSVSSDLGPSLATFDSIFRSLVDLEMTEEELETHLVYCLDRMKELKLKPTFVTFRSIMQLYEKKGDVGKALGFLAKLPRKHIHDADSNGEIFAAQLEIVERLWENGTYSQDEALTKLSETVKTMKTLQVLLSYRGYRTWLTMCLKASDVERALECYNDYVTGFRWPSADITQSMIRLVLDHDRVDDAVLVLKKAVQKDKKVTNKKGFYEAVLAYCDAKNDTENAKKVYGCMKEEKVKPNEAIQEHLRALKLI